MNAHPSTSSGLRIIGLLLAIGSTLACTAILKPDDKVSRCGNADDCEPTGDNRYVPICKYDDAHKETNVSKVDKICVADFKSITCDPNPFMNNPEHPYSVAIDDCGDLSCAVENNGKLGCPPMSGGICTEGSISTFNDVTYCGDAEVYPGFGLHSEELEAQHVKDAFCKSFFCDDTFVCNDSGKCQPCDPDSDYGDGGCGIIYNDGAPAPVYVLGDALDAACAHEDADINEPVFGGGCGA